MGEGKHVPFGAGKDVRIGEEKNFHAPTTAADWIPLGCQGRSA
jgi:hypothetical protein